MSDTQLRDLLNAAAPEPSRPLDAYRLVQAARNRRRRNRTALAAPLLLSLVLIAFPVISWPDMPARPDVSRILGGDGRTAPALQGRFPAAAIGSGQSPAEPGSQAVELATAALPDGQQLVMVGYRDASGSRCIGFVGSERLGLPSSCHATHSPAGHEGLLFARFGETDASHQNYGTSYAWGSAPPDAAFVRVSTAAWSRDFTVTTSNDPAFDDRTYFIAMLEPRLPHSLDATAYNSEGNAVAHRAR